MRQVLRTASIAAVFYIGLLRIAAADELFGVERSICPVQALTCPEALLRRCCDIYCPKPLPCLTRICHGCGKDDYCGKPRPCVPCFRGCCPTDCYCRKPCPDLCRPLAADYFICDAGSVGSAESGAYGSSAALSTAASDVADRHAKRKVFSPVSPQPGKSN